MKIKNTLNSREIIKSFLEFNQIEVTLKGWDSSSENPDQEKLAWIVTPQRIEDFISHYENKLI
jgi:hypothetical protein